MKRTNKVNYSRFCKSVTPVTLALSSLLLIGCENNDEQVTYFQTEAQCEQLNPDNQAACALAYQHALNEAVKTAPKYATQEECAAEFGMDQCATTNTLTNTQDQKNSEAQQQTTNTGSSWMPLIAGYMMGNMLSSNKANAQPMFTSKNPSSPMYGKFVDASGKNHGSATAFRSSSVPKTDMSPKPAQTSTISRGGFGQQVMAKNTTDSRPMSKSSSTGSSSSSRSYGG